MSHPRILLLSTAAGIPLLGPSGASAHLRGIARALQAVGDVTVAVPRLHDHRGAVDDALDLPVVTAPPRRWGVVPRRWRERGEVWDARRLVARAVAAHGVPDLVWERHGLFSDAGLRLAARHGVPRVVELNAPLTLERARFEDLRDAVLAEVLEKASLRGADRVVAVSDWLAGWAVAAAGCAPERVVHVPNGVEDRGPGDRSATRARLGLTGLVVGFLGTLKPWHGVERLPGILRALPDATALVVGDGPVPVPDHPRIVAVGRVAPPALPDHLAAMDVGLAPYATDTPPWFCPLKVLEYSAAGLPVVAGDAGDCRTLLAGSAGEVLGTDDPFAWADAIRRQAQAPRTPRLRTWHDVVAEALHDL